MSDYICSLRDIPRQMNFPFHLSLIGWTTRHNFLRTVRLAENYVCISFNRHKYDPSQEIVSHLSFIPVGTEIVGTNIYHDEIFFSYPPNALKPLCDFFNVNFFNIKEKIAYSDLQFNDEINDILQKIRKKMDSVSVPGIADALDILAIQAISAIIINTQNKQAKSDNVNMDIHNLAAELKQGADLQLLIKKYGFGRRTFYNEWRKFYNITPVQYKLQESLNRAANMLTTTDNSVKEICFACGFHDLIYFYQRFQKQFGVSPSQFRNCPMPLLDEKSLPKMSPPL